MLLKSNAPKVLNVPKKQILLFSFSVVFSLIFSLAESVFVQNEVAVHPKIVPFLLMYAFLNVACKIVSRPYKSEKSGLFPLRRRAFLIAILFSYVLCWLIFWPGMISHDDMHILISGMYRSFQFPPLYTAFVTFFRNIGLAAGEMSYGIILYIAVQIVVVSAVLASVLAGLVKADMPKILKYVWTVYYIALPVFACFAVSVLKDTLFSIALTTLTLSVYAISKQSEPKRKDWFVFWLSIFFVTAFRSNGIFITAGVMAALYVLFKKYKENFHTASIIILSVYWASFFILHSLDLKPLFQEKISIPLQQVAAVVKSGGELTEEQKDIISAIVSPESIRDRYSPYSVDPIKWNNPRFNRDSEYVYAFLKVWIKIMPENIAVYTKAYLQTTYGFWSPKQYRTRINISDQWNQSNKILFSFAQGNDLIKTPVIRGTVGEFLHKYYSYGTLFFQNGVLFWMVLVCAFLYYLKKQSFRALIIYLPCFILWGTLMLATPAMDIFRYVLSFAYLLPVFVTLLFADDVDFSN